MASPGHLAEGIGIGIEIAQRAERISGVATAFAVAATGVYGQVSWITEYENVEQLQRAEEAVNTNPEFLAYLDTEAKEAFQPGALTTTTVFRRMV